MTSNPTSILRKKRAAPSAGKAHPGSSPGVLQHSPEHEPTRISITAYGEEGFVEFQDVEDLNQIEELAAEWPVVWIGVNGLANIQTIEALRDIFSLEQMLLEDVLDISHHPKIELFEHLLFTITKAVNKEPPNICCCEQHVLVVEDVIVRGKVSKVFFNDHRHRAFFRFEPEEGIAEIEVRSVRI